MSIVRRAERSRRFTIIDNDVVEDAELSYRAIGLLTYILSKPDNWSVKAETLMKPGAGQEGRDAVRSTLSELELAGYIKRIKTQADRGRWMTETVVYDRPCDREIGRITTEDGFPVVGQPAVGSPVVGKPGATTSTENKDYQQEDTGRSSRPSRKSTWQTREADDPTGSTSDEPPALGAAPRKTTVERKETAARGKTTYALGLRMKMALSSAFAAPVNERAFAQQTKAWGLPIDELSAMVDVFTDNPRRYLKGDEVPWIGFVRQREVLRADAAKVLRASAPASDYAEGL